MGYTVVVMFTPPCSGDAAESLVGIHAVPADNEMMVDAGYAADVNPLRRLREQGVKEGDATPIPTFPLAKAQRGMYCAGMPYPYVFLKERSPPEAERI
jgi:hypothetical protein